MTNGVLGEDNGKNRDKESNSEASERKGGTDETKDGGASKVHSIHMNGPEVGLE